ncbi:MAG: ABC transporter ATP-binding protein [Acidobacteriota bacterium]
MTALAVNGITKRYENHLAVDNISFAVSKGSIYGLLGPNGAGKTTSIRMILNILKPDSGSISILDQPPGPGIIDRIGYLPEERGLYPKMKTLDHLMFLGEIKGVPRPLLAGRVADWMKRFELTDWKDKKVEELSKGMQQKLQFIGTVLHEPSILILDEPFSGLDPVNTSRFKDVILELNGKGTTVIFSTHVMEQVERMCQSICLLNKARIVVEGKLNEIKKRYGVNSAVVEFSGDGRFLASLPQVLNADLQGNYAELRLKEGSSPDALLQAIVGRVEIRRFEMMEPTLNSIFIDLVEGGQEAKHEPARAAAPAVGGASAAGEEAHV